ncbi:uncharacterized protein PRCAT00005301001 [Priceomyces carsonii]|uniref:uncharacterized protein n=1 Tax=Priceomyces carsonii TaxID=28549 RepID=UPI002ED8FE8C|nr:unnamed protein product [Priceomyces carsonii]
MSETLQIIEDAKPNHISETDDGTPHPSTADIISDRASSVGVREKENNEDKENKNGNGITSLSFDQVNDVADELIELRGEGRYFGVTDPSTGKTINAMQSLGPLCANCHKRGHIRAKCKTVVCHKCGVVGDHYEAQCPTTLVCAKCGLKGHIAVNCKNKQRKRQYCKICDTFSHGDDTCPTIWRSYLTLDAYDNENKTLPNMYCYNCGNNTHYGDDCKEPRTSRVPNQNGSAFSGSNLPKSLRNIYYDRLSGRAKKMPENKRDFISANTNNNWDVNRRFGNKDFNSNGRDHYRNSNGFRNNNNNNNNNTNNRNHRPAPSFLPKNPNPSRSGFVSKTKGSSANPKIPSKPSAMNRQQPTRQGVIFKNGNKVTNANPPTRSGLLENRGRNNKQKSRNIRNLY